MGGASKGQQAITQGEGLITEMETGADKINSEVYTSGSPVAHCQRKRDLQIWRRPQCALHAESIINGLPPPGASWRLFLTSISEAQLGPFGCQRGLLNNALFTLTCSILKGNTILFSFISLKTQARSSHRPNTLLPTAGSICPLQQDRNGERSY